MDIAKILASSAFLLFSYQSLGVHVARVTTICNAHPKTRGCGPKAIFRQHVRVYTAADNMIGFDFLFFVIVDAIVVVGSDFGTSAVDEMKTIAVGRGARTTELVPGATCFSNPTTNDWVIIRRSTRQ